MKKTSRAQKSIWKELPYLVSVALFVSHIFVSIQEKENYLEIVFAPGYFLALAVTFIVAFLMILGIKLITRALEKKYPWEKDKWLRFIMQFLVGGVLILLFEYACTATYFLLNGIPISETIYFDTYLLSIITFIIIVNAYYNFNPDYERNPDYESKSDYESNPDESDPTAGSPSSIDLVDYCKEHNVVYISVSGKYCFAKDGNGTSLFWEHSLKRSIADLPKEYYLANRQVIVHRKIITELVEDVQNHRIDVVLEPGFEKGNKITVINALLFKQWWDSFSD